LCAHSSRINAKEKMVGKTPDIKSMLLAVLSFLFRSRSQLQM
jgi:hypothetical protein